jgi:hypothetical protein
MSHYLFGSTAHLMEFEEEGRKSGGRETEEENIKTCLVNRKTYYSLTLTIFCSVQA